MNYAEVYKRKTNYIHDNKYGADWAVWRMNNENRIYIRFEGTKSFLDVLMDLFCIRSKVKAYDGADWYAHSGFKKAYYSVRDDILDKCYELYQEGDEFTILGHSLGGAMALLATEDIGWHFKKKVLCVTWGAPRVAKDSNGTEAIKSYMAEGSYNFENGSDLIVNLPWWFKKSPIVAHIGEHRFSTIRAIKDLIFNGCKKYHCGYGDEEHYITFLSSLTAN